MNKAILFSSVLLVSLTLTYGQETQGVKANLEANTGSNGTTNAVVSVPSLTPKPAQSKITYGGFLVDVAPGSKPIKIIDPKNPVRVRGNGDNVYNDPQTGKPRGFVLLAIKF